MKVEIVVYQDLDDEDPLRGTSNVDDINIGIENDKIQICFIVNEEAEENEDINPEDVIGETCSFEDFKKFMRRS